MHYIQITDVNSCNGFALQTNQKIEQQKQKRKHQTALFSIENSTEKLNNSFIIHLHHSIKINKISIIHN